MHPFTRLEGLARELYLACDRVRPLAWLARDGERFLSLALGGKASMLKSL